MSFHSPGKFLITFLLLFVMQVVVSGTRAQTHDVPLRESANKDALNTIDLRAKDLVANNMNRFAVEKLKTYNSFLDSLYKKEINDTLAKIENAYLTKSSRRISTISDYRKQIKDLSEQKEKLDARYWALAKKALLSFSIWLLIVLVLLLLRKKKFKSSQTVLLSATTQLNSLEESLIKSQQLFSDLKLLKDPYGKLNSEYTRLNTIISDTGSTGNSPSGWQELIPKSQKLKLLSDSEENILNALLSQSEIKNEEKVSSDINSICDYYLEIASRGFEKTDEFNYQVTRDFEKRIPSIMINPTAVGTLLLNVLTNAFQSLKEKNRQAIKGYQPKLSVSTRILPRFLQIRIKDNGMGMTEEILRQSTGEFFSTRPLSDGAGLGLYFASNIISEMHKGEIKIESEEGNSTDVYIKFYL